MTDETRDQPDLAMDAPILFFDGVCDLCNSSVQFFLRHERVPWARFGLLQSAVAGRLLQEYELDAGALETLVLIEDGRVYLRSSAALRAARLLRRPWCWLGVLLWVPRPLRNFGYRVVAKLRYRLFGRRAVCLVPDEGLRGRFLEESGDGIGSW